MHIPLRGWLVPLAAALVLLAVCVQARAQESLREWFNKLQNQQGHVCCHNFDGISMEETDWRTGNGKYQVLVKGQWIDVPPHAVVAVPNRLGRAHLWLNADGGVRCFIPGALI